MDDILLKYNSLDAVSKKQVRDFINQIVDKMKTKKDKLSYNERSFLVSTWSDRDGILLSRWSVK